MTHVLLTALTDAVIADSENDGHGISINITDSEFNVVLETDEGTFCYHGNNPQQFMELIHTETGIDTTPMWINIEAYIDAFWAVLNDHYQIN